uniref:Uncharacterized protein n=1 Tax=uncultured prokaryote TaxID=198431 RepID=A0A0H5Q614_9ZZZZ|nr:hypothetical protein [uncultured prokaryote]
MPLTNDEAGIQITFVWEVDRKGWLGRVTCNGICVQWRRFDHSGAPCIQDARMAFEAVAREVEGWLY